LIPLFGSRFTSSFSPAYLFVFISPWQIETTETTTTTVPIHVIGNPDAELLDNFKEVNTQAAACYNTAVDGSGDDADVAGQVARCYMQQWQSSKLSRSPLLIIPPEALRTLPVHAAVCTAQLIQNCFVQGQESIVARGDTIECFICEKVRYEY
jgi:hypothetical protein